MFMPFGCVMRDGNIRAELAQNARRRFVSCAICNIDRDPHFFERHSARKTGFGEFDIAAERIIDSRGASDFVWRSAGWNRSRR